MTGFHSSSVRVKSALRQCVDHRRSEEAETQRQLDGPPHVTVQGSDRHEQQANGTTQQDNDQEAQWEQQCVMSGLTHKSTTPGISNKAGITLFISALPNAAMIKASWGKLILDSMLRALPMISCMAITELLNAVHSTVPVMTNRGYGTLPVSMVTRLVR